MRTLAGSALTCPKCEVLKKNGNQENKRINKNATELPSPEEQN